jgi:hypothetical protein
LNVLILRGSIHWTDALVLARMPLPTSHQWQQYVARMRPILCGISPDAVQLLRVCAISVLLSGYGEPSVQRFFSCELCSTGCAILFHDWQGNGPIRHVETCPDFFFHCKSTHNKIHCQNSSC